MANLALDVETKILWFSTRQDQPLANFFPNLVVSLPKINKNRFFFLILLLQYALDFNLVYFMPSYLPNHFPKPLWLSNPFFSTEHGVVESYGSFLMRQSSEWPEIRVNVTMSRAALQMSSIPHFHRMVIYPAASRQVIFTGQYQPKGLQNPKNFPDGDQPFRLIFGGPGMDSSRS